MENIKKDKYELSDISSVRNWNYTLPTITRSNRFTKRVTWKKPSDFWLQFTKKYPMFEEVSLKDIALCGGCIVDLILYREPRDVDLFFILSNEGNKGEALANRVKAFIEEVINYMKKKNIDYESKKLEFDKEEIEKSKSKILYNLEEIYVSRYKNVYTIIAPCISIPIQISYCSSIENLFKQIDISATEVVYYNHELLISHNGKFSIENLAFYINDNDSSPKYLERVKKYFDKGFDIILPNIDIDKINTKNLKYGYVEICDLPFLFIVIKEIKNNKIEVESIKTTSHTKTDCFKDNDDYSMAFGITSKPGAIIHHNIKQLISNNFDKFIYAGKGNCYNEIFSTKVNITERMLINSYETIKRKILHKGSINISLLEQYFKFKNIDYIINEVLVEYVEKNKDKQEIFNINFDRYVSEKLDLLVEKQIQDAKNRLLDLIGIDGLKYEVSFPVLKCSKREWYGEYYKNF